VVHGLGVSTRAGVHSVVHGLGVSTRAGVHSVVHGLGVSTGAGVHSVVNGLGSPHEQEFTVWSMVWGLHTSMSSQCGPWSGVST